MCAIFAIVQFEVHCYQDGRWTVQARYPSDERQKAISDAVSTEQMTRRPCKVVKETYYPHENQHDTVTVYVSPRAKEMIAKLKKPAAGHTGEAGAARAAKGMEARSGIKPAVRAIAPKAADLFWRSIIAMVLSLVAATIVTAMVSWIFSRLPDFGIHLDPSIESAVLTMSYMGVFLFGVLSLFRFGAPIKRLLAVLWASAVPAAQMTSAESASIFKAAGWRLKPKRSNKVAFERERQEIDEMKRRRGDLDTLPPEEPEDEQVPPQGVPVIEEIPPPKPVLQPEPKPAPLAEPIPVQQTQDVSASASEPEKIEGKKKLDIPTAPPSIPPEPPLPAPGPAIPASVAEALEKQGISELHRALALRFTLEVAAPQVARAPDDPVARRGAALFMTGAMAHLASLSNLGPTGEMALTVTALPNALPQQAVDAFIGQYNAHITAPMNTIVITHGRQAMARFLSGQSNEGALTAALAAWRTPQTAVPEPESVPDPGAPSDYYLMTDFRHDNDASLEAHNRTVREVLERCDGREIKHTGRGILARFATADNAIRAAFELNAALTTASNIPAEARFSVALISGHGANDDPLVSATVMTQAQEMTAEAPRGSVICQTEVEQHATPSPGLSKESFAGHWLRLIEASTASQVETAA